MNKPRQDSDNLIRELFAIVHPYTSPFAAADTAGLVKELAAWHQSALAVALQGSVEEIRERLNAQKRNPGLLDGIHPHAAYNTAISFAINTVIDILNSVDAEHPVEESL